MSDDTAEHPAETPENPEPADQGDAVDATVGSTVDSDDHDGVEQDRAEQGGAESDEGGPDERPSKVERLEREGDIAADYLEELLDIADLDGDLDMDVDGDRAAVSVVGGDLDQLVGRNGEVLDALQELTRLAVYRETGERSRLMLDVAGFRADKRVALVKLAEESIAQVRSSGDRVALDPMTSFERKVVHDVVTAAGMTSESEGAEPRRFVVILPS